MATAPPSSGGIVTVPDPTTGGAGAPVITSQVFNAMWQNAQQKSAAAIDYTTLAQMVAGPAPHMSANGIDANYSWLPPAVPILPEENRLDGEAMYSSQRDQLYGLIQGAMSAFVEEWFPRPEYYEEALDWCHNAITAGGSGLNPLVEQQLWERARARILADSARAEDEAINTFANRRFPQPPGALAGALQQINLESGRKLAEQGRDIAIKSFDTEVENVRLAMKTVIDQRQVALQSMGDYIRTVMQGPQTAMQLATGLAGIRSEAARNMVALYQAQASAADPRIKLIISDAQLRQQAGEANLRSDMANIDARTRAMMEMAKMLGQQAASGLNAIHASASISASDSTSN